MRINEFVPDTSIFQKNFTTNKKENDDKSNSFVSLLKEQLDKVNEKQVVAADTTSAFVKGEIGDIHQVMLATEEAKLSLELAVQVRNKLMEAYQELTRMQL